MEPYFLHEHVPRDQKFVQGIDPGLAERVETDSIIEPRRCVYVRSENRKVDKFSVHR